MKSTRPDNKAQYVEIPPNAARTLAALRELGYASIPAICDLIDNSIGAKATCVEITVRQNGKDRVIEIVDDGHGMGRDTLHEAMRFGSDTDKYKSTDLGKYGMGLKSASLSIAKRLWVLTREKGEQAYEATFDVDTITRLDDWKIELKPALHNVLDLVGDYGTLVRLSSIDRLDDTNVTRFSDKLGVEISRVFRHFLKKGLKIKLNGTRLEAVDPLMRKAGARVKFDDEIILGRGKHAHLTIVELPDLGAEQDEAAGILPQRGGFYVMRNHREIMAAQTFGFYKHHHSYSHFRAELSFSGDLDQDFHVDVKKTSITPNDLVLERIRDVAQRFIAESGKEGQERAIEKTELTHKFASSLLNKAHTAVSHDGNRRSDIEFSQSDHGTSESLFRVVHDDNGKMRIDYNKRHPFIRMIANHRLQKSIGILDCMTIALARIASESPEGSAVVDRVNAAIRVVLSEGTPSDTYENVAKEVKQQK